MSYADPLNKCSFLSSGHLPGLRLAQCPCTRLSGAASPAEGARLHVGPVALAAAGARRGLSSVVQLHCIIGGLDFFRGYPETRGLVITSWICADIEDLCGEF